MPGFAVKNSRLMLLKAVYRKRDRQVLIKLAILAEKNFFISRRSLESGKCGCTLYFRLRKFLCKKCLTVKSSSVNIHFVATQGRSTGA